MAGSLGAVTCPVQARAICFSLRLSSRMRAHLLPCSAALGAFFNDPKGQACDLGKDVPFPQVGGWPTAGQIWVAGAAGQPCQQASAIMCAPE